MKPSEPLIHICGKNSAPPFCPAKRKPITQKSKIKKLLLISEKVGMKLIGLFRGQEIRKKLPDIRFLFGAGMR